jgi:hypothetical protein
MIRGAITLVLLALNAAFWGGCITLLGIVKFAIHITAPRSRDGVPRIRLHPSRSLDEKDTTSREGIPLTSIARTLLDLAATVSESRLERALAQAERVSSSTTTAPSPTSSAQTTGIEDEDPSRERSATRPS